MSSWNTLLAGLLLALSATPAAAENASLTVDIVGAEPPTGTIEISVFNTDESFLKQTYLQSRCTPTDEGRCRVNFGSVPAGDYAVVVVHDANGNQKLDSGFLGFGAESFAYSNDASNPLFGRASFDDAKIHVDGATEIEIDLD